MLPETLSRPEPAGLQPRRWIGPCRPSGPFRTTAPDAPAVSPPAAVTPRRESFPAGSPGAWRRGSALARRRIVAPVQGLRWMLRASVLRLAKLRRLRTPTRCRIQRAEIQEPRPRRGLSAESAEPDGVDRGWASPAVFGPGRFRRESPVRRPGGCRTTDPERPKEGFPDQARPGPSALRASQRPQAEPAPASAWGPCEAVRAPGEPRPGRIPAERPPGQRPSPGRRPGRRRQAGRSALQSLRRRRRGLEQEGHRPRGRGAAGLKTG